MARVVPAALMFGMAFAGAALAACSSFSPADAEDGGADAAGGSDGDAAPLGNDAEPDDGVPDAPLDTSGGSKVLFTENFDAVGSCGTWTTLHFATFEHIDGGNNGSGGACRICVAGSDSTSPPFVERTVLNPPSGVYIVTGYFRAPADGTPVSLSVNALGFQFDLGPEMAISKTSPVALGPTWAATSTSFQSPNGTIDARVTIEIGGTIGTCYDVDDVSLMVTP